MTFLSAIRFTCNPGATSNNNDNKSVTPNEWNDEAISEENDVDDDDDCVSDWTWKKKERKTERTNERNEKCLDKEDSSKEIKEKKRVCVRERGNECGMPGSLSRNFTLSWRCSI